MQANDTLLLKYYYARFKKTFLTYIRLQLVAAMSIDFLCETVA